MKTIKAQKVNELEFLTEKDGSYEYQFPAIISVKVENAVREIRIQEEKNKGSYIRKESEDLVKIKELMGVEIDYSEILEEYEAKLVHIKQNQDEIKKKKASEKYNQQYNSWVKGLVDASKDYPEIKLNVESEESYVKKCLNYSYSEITVRFSYKGVESSIEYKKIGGDTWGYGATYKYCIDGSFTEHRRRSYKDAKSVLPKIKELIDAKLSQEEAQKQRKTREQNDREEKRAHFEETFGYTCEIDSTYRSSRYRGGHGYYDYTYYLVVGERKLAISKHNEENYSIAGIRNLPAEKIKQIISVL